LLNHENHFPSFLCHVLTVWVRGGYVTAGAWWVVMITGHHHLCHWQDSKLQPQTLLSL